MFENFVQQGEVMKKLLAIAVALSALSLPAMAQEQLQRVEVFGGYQFSHFDPSIDANGWNLAISGNLNRWLGITGDFSGVYKNSDHIYSFMAGPTFSARIKRVTPFAHWLIGGASSCGSCDNAFAMAVGGGFDVNANDHFAIRVLQADWLLFGAGGVTDKKNARLSTGVVFRF
jgi:opacity protein-like surface antigen